MIFRTLVIASAILSSTSVFAAETVSLILKANGQIIQGDNSQTSLGRQNTIECYGFSMAVKTAREAGSGMATGRRAYEPITCTKLVDRSSPLLVKALAENQVIEGTFKAFRPSPTGDGTTEQFYTVTIKQGRISSVKQASDAMSATSSSSGIYEEVTFVFTSINMTFTNGGISFEDSVREPR